VCAGLAAATAHALAVDAAEHSVAQLGEARCVHIDPSTQQTSDGTAAAAGAWHHVAALGLPADDSLRAGALSNLDALECARMPQGIILETCPPDFAHFRAPAVMLFVLASWACLLLAVGLAWLWLQTQRPGAPATGSQTRAARAAALLAALSAALLVLHFAEPAREAAADREWAGHANNRSSANVSSRAGTI